MTRPKLSLAKASALILLSAIVAPAAEFDHSAWDRVLKAYVNDKGEVDYAAIKARPKDVETYLYSIWDASPVNKPALFPTRDSALAYWINAYNALVTTGVAAKYPTKSVRDLGALLGFFRGKDYIAGGEPISLNNIEHDTLRKQFKEPRIHFAIVCASLGCPMLSRYAYQPGLVQQQLDQRARFFVSEDRNVRIDPKRNEVWLSKIFDWYGGDFGGEKELIPFIIRYSSETNRHQLEQLKSPKIRYFDYDWHINDLGSRK